MRLCVVLLLGLGALWAPAGATTALRYDLTTLARTADAIVVGQVTALQSAWRDGRIVTQVTVSGDEVLKGPRAPRYTVEVLGGTVDGIGQKVAGMAAFEPGEHVVLFLRAASGDSTFEVVGLGQGKLRVEVGLSGPALIQDLGELRLVDRAADGALTPTQTAARVRVPLNDFLHAVREAVAAGPAR